MEKSNNPHEPRTHEQERYDLKEEFVENINLKKSAGWIKIHIKDY